MDQNSTHHENVIIKGTGNGSVERANVDVILHVWERTAYSQGRSFKGVTLEPEYRPTTFVEDVVGDKRDSHQNNRA